VSARATRRGWAWVAALVALTVGCGAEPPEAQDAHAPEMNEHAEHTPSAHGAPIEGVVPHADRSIYQLADPWTDANGAVFRLGDLRGSPVLVLFFYGTCEHACPILVHDLQRLDDALTPTQRAAVRYLLVTFDPERDTPERLAAYARDKGLADGRWHLIHGRPEQVRALSLVLGIRYRPTGDGGFSHTSRITLLDPEGVATAYIDGLERPQETLLTPLTAMLNTPESAATP
jgi:protein SCO1/2